MKSHQPSLLCVAKAAFYSLCFVLMMSQVVMFVMKVMANPISSLVTSVPFEVDTFKTFIVCTDGWFGWKRSENFPVGYLENFRNLLNESLEPEFDLLNAEWAASVFSFSDFVDQMEDFYSQMNISNKKVPSEPLYFDAGFACGRFEKHKSQFYQMGWMSETKEQIFFYFKTPQNMERNVLISMYQPISVQFLRRRDYYSDKYPGWKKATYMTLEARVTKLEHIKDADYPCEEAPDGIISPLGYLQTKCYLMCTLEAHSKSQNCTPILQLDPNNTSVDKATGSPFCHYFNTWARKGLNLRETFNGHRKACIEREKCDLKRYCMEWSIDLYPVKTTVSSKNKGGNNDTSYHTIHKVSLAFHPRMTVIKEYRIYTSESIMGNIGGLAGFWIGLSVFGISGALFSCAEGSGKKRRKANKRMVEIRR